MNYRSAIETSRQFKESSAVHKFKVVIKMLILRWRAKKHVESSQLKQFKSNFQEVKKVMRIVHHNVALRLKEEQTNENVLEINIVLNQYYNRLNRIRRNRNTPNETPDTITEAHKLEGLYIQRTYLDELIQNEQIDAHVAAQVREHINYNEIILTSK